MNIIKSPSIPSESIRTDLCQRGRVVVSLLEIEGLPPVGRARGDFIINNSFNKFVNIPVVQL